VFAQFIPANGERSGSSDCETADKIRGWKENKRKRKA